MEHVRYKAKWLEHNLKKTHSYNLSFKRCLLPPFIPSSQISPLIYITPHPLKPNQPIMFQRSPSAQRKERKLWSRIGDALEPLTKPRVYKMQHIRWNKNRPKSLKNTCWKHTCIYIYNHTGNHYIHRRLGSEGVRHSVL